MSKKPQLQRLIVIDMIILLTAPQYPDSRRWTASISSQGQRQQRLFPLTKTLVTRLQLRRRHRSHNYSVQHLQVLGSDHLLRRQYTASRYFDTCETFTSNSSQTVLGVAHFYQQSQLLSLLPSSSLLRFRPLVDMLFVCVLPLDLYVSSSTFRFLKISKRGKLAVSSFLSMSIEVSTKEQRASAEKTIHSEIRCLLHR